MCRQTTGKMADEGKDFGPRWLLKPHVSLLERNKENMVELRPCACDFTLVFVCMHASVCVIAIGE